jgi:hypothetical protein
VWPAFFRLTGPDAFFARNCRFDRGLIYVLPPDPDAVNSVDDCATDRVDIQDCEFLGDGQSGSASRHIYIRASAKVKIKGNIFSGENMLEYIKTSLFTGEQEIHGNRFVGSTEDEVMDAYTSWGPIKFERNIARMTAGAILTYKPDGGSGPNVSWPKQVTIADNDLQTDAQFSILATGARTLAWEGSPQSIDISRNRLIASGAAGSRALTVRGHHRVRIEDNIEIGAVAVDSPGTFGAVDLSGNGDTSVIGNIIKDGNIFEVALATSLGTPYGQSEFLRVDQNTFLNATRGGAVAVGTGRTVAGQMHSNTVLITHDQVATSTRPFNNAGAPSFWSFFANSAKITGAAGSVTPIGLTTIVRYHSQNNEWDNVVRYGTAAPADGTWRRGDIVLRSNPSNSGKAGFVCTVAGSPGTWKEFGVIDA